VIRTIAIEQPETGTRLSRAAALSAIARARRDPQFYIVDGNLRLLSATESLADAERPSLPPDVREAARLLLGRRRVPGEALVIPLHDDAILRLVPAVGPESLYVIFVTEARNPIALAAKRYGFTTREIEMLELLLQGKSTGDIAAKLSISHLTVLQHVKNVGQKMGVSKRKEIVATLTGAR
jgi:DNA-binding CsgD family transcriptional regulator